jgi:hypothetical protein
MRIITLVLTLVWFSVAVGQDAFSYDAIAKRHPATSLGTEAVSDAKMQGECLVGLKNLNFQKRSDFDPVAEWTNYRSLSLLEQYPPCHVLIMMEIARAELLKQEAEES